MIEKKMPHEKGNFLSPSGEIHTDIKSLTAFCNEHNLQHSSMSLVARGKQREYKGWTVYPPIDFKEKRFYRGPALISPEGIVYSNIIHLSKFCEERGLSQPVMSQLAYKKIKTYKGWKVYEENQPE